MRIYWVVRERTFVCLGWEATVFSFVLPYFTYVMMIDDVSFFVVLCSCIILLYKQRHFSTNKHIRTTHLLLVWWLVIPVVQEMLFYTLKLIKHFAYSGIRSFPMEIIPFQQLLMNTLMNKTQMGPLMAQPFELIDMSENWDIKFDTKPERWSYSSCTYMYLGLTYTITLNVHMAHVFSRNIGLNLDKCCSMYKFQ